ncbi:MAG: energy transducer TonB [Thiobacillaceae bacterium]|nr:energy transducer TonB [Thiobacillaceae bacterium]
MTLFYGPRLQPHGVLITLVAHALVLAALLSLQPVAHTVGLQRPLLVSLITPNPPPAEPPKPLPPKPRPQPQAPRHSPPPPVLTAPAAAPSPVTAPPPPPEPVPVPVVLPPPQPPVATSVAAPPAPPPVTPPRFDADYLDNPAPPYPALSRRLGEEGRVLLRVYVLPDGSAGQVQVRESSGHERLDRAALETVRRWRFVPARQGEEPVAAWVLVPIAFSLRS